MFSYTTKRYDSGSQPCVIRIGPFKFSLVYLSNIKLWYKHVVGSLPSEWGIHQTQQKGDRVNGERESTHWMKDKARQSALKQNN